MLGIEGLAAPENRAAAKWGLGLALLAMLVRAGFWAYTQRYWEDALITCLHSENFVQGLGLTHVRPGEPPLHGFTSPLSVLVPLMGDFMHVGFGIEFIKLVSIPAAALTVLYLLGICIHSSVRLPLPLTVMVMGYAAFEHHQMLWGMAGMETQLAALAIVGSLYHAVAWHPKRLGVWLGICMLARPDYCFWCAIVGVYGLFRDWRRMGWVVGLACAVYLPWIAFTLWEYGSPVPNTIIAKNQGYRHWYRGKQNIGLEDVAWQFWKVMSTKLHVMLGPTFFGHGALLVVFQPHQGMSPIGNVMFGFSALGAVALALGRRFTLWPLVLCVIIYSLYFAFLVPLVFGWYRVPYLLTLLLLAAWGIHTAVRAIPNAGIRSGILWAFTTVYLGAFACVLPWTIHTEHQIQHLIENKVRMPAGLWLREHMKPDEAVGGEPLGYIGYYSRGNVYDWPGLASLKVVAWSQSVPAPKRNIENMLKELQPEYLFLRDSQLNKWFKDPQWFRAHYHPVAVFQVSPEDRKKILWLGFNVDTSFRMLKKNRSGDAPYDDSLWPASLRTTQRPVVVQ